MSHVIPCPSCQEMYEAPEPHPGDPFAFADCDSPLCAVVTFRRRIP